MDQKLQPTGRGGDWLSLLDPNVIDAWVMSFLHILQKYGELCKVVLIFIVPPCIVLAFYQSNS